MVQSNRSAKNSSDTQSQSEEIISQQFNTPEEDYGVDQADKLAPTNGMEHITNSENRNPNLTYFSAELKPIDTPMTVKSIGFREPEIHSSVTASTVPTMSPPLMANLPYTHQSIRVKLVFSDTSSDSPKNRNNIHAIPSKMTPSLSTPITRTFVTPTTTSGKRTAFRNACSGIQRVYKANETTTGERGEDGTIKKRGPGRPRKHPKPECITSVVLSNEVHQQSRKKRGPGRPRKHRTTTCEVKHKTFGSTQEIEDYSVTARSNKVRKLNHRVAHPSNVTAHHNNYAGTMLQHVPDDIIFANPDMEYDALWLSRADEIFSNPSTILETAQAPSSSSQSQKPIHKRLSFMPSQKVDLQTHYFSPIRPKSLDSSVAITLEKDRDGIPLSDDKVGVAKVDCCTPLREDQDADASSLVEFSWKSSMSYSLDGAVSDLPSLDVDALVAFEEKPMNIH